MSNIIQPRARLETAGAGGYNPGAMAREILRPKVALIGRPNIGKSTLFNRLIGYNARRGGRAAIVDELAGVTRDRLYGLCEWDGYEFTIIDCGGIGEESEDPLWLPVAENSRRAMAEAELIIFMTDARTGATISDDAVLKELRRLAKPVIVAVNKVDHEVHEPGAYEFYRLGYSDVMFISALSGRKVGDLLDLVVERLDWSAYETATPAFAAFRYGDAEPEAAQDVPESAPPAADMPDDEEGDYPFAWAATGESRFVPDESWRGTPVRLVFVGRQNVGKSSLTNALIGQERALVADLPGTTRDPLLCRFERGGGNYELLDTAGMQRITRLKEDVDYYSLIRAEKSLRHSEVALLTVDASEGVIEQDKRVASKIAEMHRAVVIAVNKTDLLVPPEDEEDTPAMVRRGKTRAPRVLSPDAAMRQAHLRYVRGELDQLSWAEVVYTSATTGEGLDELLAAASRARENFHCRLDNTALRTVLREAITLNPPPVVKNRELRFYDFRQIGNCPPAFLIEVNDKLTMRGAYLRFLENTMRKHFPLLGTHIELVIYAKKKHKK
jgi:GTPase